MLHQRARGGHIKRMFNALVEFARIKALEIRTLPPVHINDLDVIAGFHKVAFGGLGVHTNVVDRIGQRVGQREPRRLFDDGAATFIDKMLKIAMGRDVLSIVDDEWGRPTPVSALAGQLMALADMLVRQPDRVPAVLHLGPPNPVSRFAWAQQIFAASEAVGGPAPRLQRVSADAFETAARRPRGLVLDVSKAERLLGSMPDWEPFSERAVRRLLT